MKTFIGVTDNDWFELLARQPDIEEVNFWQPGGQHLFRALRPGELFLFKLHSPQNFIVGGGVFAHATLLPVSLAWSSFGIKNGAESLEQMRSRIERYRRRPADRRQDYQIGCILLTQPFFFPRDLWLAPPGWKPNIVQGRGYDLEAAEGHGLFSQVQERLQLMSARLAAKPEIRERLPVPAEGYGRPVLVKPRLGQGAFRVLVTEVYERRCVVSEERVLPVLEAAHVRPYASGGRHEVGNGVLLRSDLHTLFDQGYLTITPDCRVEVSRRIRDDFDNGREYYRHHGKTIRPGRRAERPESAALEWHNQNVFLG